MTHASTGHEAIKCVQEKSYDVIFMDLHMPHMSGIEAATKIREVLRNKSCPPIIALTASPALTEKQRALSGGLDDFLSKPVDEFELWKVIEKHTEWMALSNTKDVESLPASTLEAIINGNANSASSSPSYQLQTELLAMFFDELPSYKEKILVFSQQADWTELAETIHRLRGSAVYCDMSGLATTTGRLEELLLEQSSSSVILETVHSVVSQIDTLLNSNVKRGRAQ